LPVLAAGERQVDQVIAYGFGRKGTLYLTDRRLVFEWSDGLVNKRYQQVGITLADVQGVGVNHPRLGAGELIITTANSNNGFHSNRVTLGIAMNPEVWMSKINGVLRGNNPQSMQPTMVIEREITKEVVKTPCRYCGTLVDAFRSNKCPSCGAPLY
jgi:hypothetical protein